MRMRREPALRMIEIALLSWVCCDIGIADPDVTLQANPGLPVGHVLKDRYQPQQ